MYYRGNFYGDAMMAFFDEVPMSIWKKILAPSMSYHWADPYGDFRRPVLDLIPYLNGAKKILEVGCGFGGVAIPLIEHMNDVRITGLTNSRVQYDYLKESNIKNFNVMYGDAEKWDSDERFDAIIFYESISHMTDEVIIPFSKNTDLFVIKDYVWDDRYYSDAWLMHFRKKSDFKNMFDRVNFEVKPWKESGTDFWITGGRQWLDNINKYVTEEELKIYQVGLLKHFLEYSFEHPEAVEARLYTFTATRKKGGNLV